MVEYAHSIWIVDDSEADQSLLRIAFDGFIETANIRSFFAAEDALGALGDQEPSLIFLDLNMPGGGGEHFLRERSNRGYIHIPVVVITSSANPKDIRNAYHLGANSYLEKPSNLDGFRRFARVVSEYWFQWAHLPRAGR